MDSARVVLLFEDAELVGYYALTMGSVPRDEPPKSLVRGGPSEIGVVLLAKLAVSQDRQGEGLGAYLLARALQAAASAGALAAARLVVVDAFEDEVVPFYTRWGFRNLPQNPLRLYARLSDIVKTLSDVGLSAG